MKWTKKDKQYLLDLRQDIDVDDIKLKEEIKRVLLNDKYIIHVLNNTDLEKSDAEPDDYFGVNILPFYMIQPTQTNVQNFICYETSYQDVPQWDKNQKYQQIIFYVLCEQKNIIDKDTSLARHDLLASLIIRAFNFEPFFGGRFKLVKNAPGVTDNNYALRTLTFEQMTDNNLVKKVNGQMVYGRKSGVI